MPSGCTKTVTKALDKIFSMFGYVHKLVADNGKQLISDEFKQYLKQHGLKLRNVTPYSPWVNGEVERFNRSLKKANQCAHAEGKDWRQELNKFLLLYRTTPHATTGQRPATVFLDVVLRMTYQNTTRMNLKIQNWIGKTGKRKRK